MSYNMMLLGSFLSIVVFLFWQTSTGSTASLWDRVLESLYEEAPKSNTMDRAKEVSYRTNSTIAAPQASVGVSMTERSTTTEEIGVIHRATRNGDKLVRPWEWQLLEAIRLDDPFLVRIAAEDPSVNWGVLVGSHYANPQDENHLYYLVRSFGGLQWEVGQTLSETARLNRRFVACAAIEQEMEKVVMSKTSTTILPQSALDLSVDVELTTTEEVGVIHQATRNGDKSVRPWEWQLLEAIRLDDSSLVQQAARHPSVNWGVSVGPNYANPEDKKHLYYLVRSFGGLRWKVGQSLAETARLNKRFLAATAIDQATEISEQIVI